MSFPDDANIGLLTKLVKLVCPYKTNLTDESLVNLTNLRNLQLFFQIKHYYNQCPPAFTPLNLSPKSISNMRNLQKLYCYDTMLNNEVLGQLLELKHLSIHGNCSSLNDEGISLIEEYPTWKN